MNHSVKSGFQLRVDVNLALALAVYRLLRSVIGQPTRATFLANEKQE